MLITIIIPTFNSQKYLRKTLESLRNQQYKNFEIILLDNCIAKLINADNGNEICLSYRAIFIPVFNSKCLSKE